MGEKYRKKKSDELRENQISRPLIYYKMEKKAIEMQNWNIGQITSIEDLISEFKSSPIIRNNLYDLMKTYGYIRRVRGDGNCFYRAVMFQYLEKVIFFGRDFIISFMNSIRIPNEYSNLSKENPIVKGILLGHLSQILENEEKISTSSAYQLFLEMIICSEQFDWALIRFLRRMVANFLQNKWDMKFNDIPITEDIGQQTIEQYRDNVVLKDNIEAEGIIIQIIPLVLRINLITVIFDLNNKGFEKVYPQFNPSNRPSLCIQHSDLLNWHQEQISVILKPGHYDIGYENKYKEIIIKYHDNGKELFANLEVMSKQELQTSTPCCNSVVDREWYKAQLESKIPRRAMFKLKEGRAQIPKCYFCKRALEADDLKFLYEGAFIEELKKRCEESCGNKGGKVEHKIEVCSWCREEIKCEHVIEDYKLTCGHKFHVKCLENIMELVEDGANANCAAPGCKYIISIPEKIELKGLFERRNNSSVIGAHRGNIIHENIGKCGICSKFINKNETEFLELRCKHLLHNKCIQEDSSNIFMSCPNCRIYLEREERDIILTIQRSKEYGKEDELKAQRSLQYETCKICFRPLNDVPMSMFTTCAHYFHQICLRKHSSLLPQCPYCHKNLNKADLQLYNNVIHSTIPGGRSAEEVKETMDYSIQTLCQLCDKQAINSHQYFKLGCGHRFHIKCVNELPHLFSKCPGCKYIPKQGEVQKRREANRDASSSHTPFFEGNSLVSQGSAEIDSTSICDICHKGINLQKENTVELMRCKHRFHFRCINTHFSIYAPNINKNVKLTCPFRHCGTTMSDADTNQIFKTPQYTQDSVIQTVKAPFPSFQQQSCSCCKQNIPYGKEQIKLPCSHLFHKKCLLSYIDKSTQGLILLTKYEETTFRLCCPSCQFKLTNQIVVELLDPDIVQTYISDTKDREKIRETETPTRPIQISRSDESISLECCQPYKININVLKRQLNEEIKKETIIRKNDKSFQLISCIYCKEEMSRKDLEYLIGIQTFQDLIREVCCFCGKKGDLFSPLKKTNCLAHKMCDSCKLYNKYPNDNMQCKLCRLEFGPNDLKLKQLSLPIKFHQFQGALKDADYPDFDLLGKICIKSCCVCEDFINIYRSTVLECLHYACPSHLAKHGISFCNACNAYKDRLSFCLCNDASLLNRSSDNIANYLEMRDKTSMGSIPCTTRCISCKKCIKPAKLKVMFGPRIVDNLLKHLLSDGCYIFKFPLDQYII